MAGAVPEALRAAKAGANIIIAQRTEGGGHVGWMVSMPLATVNSPGPAIRPPLARLAQRLRLIGPLCVPELQEPGIVRPSVMKHEGLLMAGLCCKLLAALRTCNYRIQMNGIFKSTLRACAPGRFRGDHAEAAGARAETEQRRSMGGIPAVDHRLCDPADLGHRSIQGLVNPFATWNYPVPALHNMINQVPPVAAQPKPESAVFAFTWLSYTGSGMLIAAIIAGFIMGFSPVRLVKAYGETIKVCFYSLITISAMLAIGTLIRLSGVDATLGLAFAGAGVLYPFFGTLLGWLGVALTGSDTASNILFGNLQKITSEQLGLSPILMGAANSSGGVMGKMIDAQSIVVASTATNWFGHEGTILRFVFWHSIALACLFGVLVMLQAHVFTWMIVQ